MLGLTQTCPLDVSLSAQIILANNKPFWPRREPLQPGDTPGQGEGRGGKEVQEMKVGMEEEKKKGDGEREREMRR